ncbi:hypothetical protein [Qipengyuania citrea]|uniref:hypothetical protein n=1 Tax=Qipengyuania citrea TaxID=225971 RepID=UPI003296F559
MDEMTENTAKAANSICRASELMLENCSISLNVPIHFPSCKVGKQLRIAVKGSAASALTTRDASVVNALMALSQPAKSTFSLCDA